MTDEAMSPLRAAHDRRYDDPQVSAEDPNKATSAPSRILLRFLGRSPRHSELSRTSDAFQLHLAAKRPRTSPLSITPWLRCGSSSGSRSGAPTSSSTRTFIQGAPEACRSCSVPGGGGRGCWMQRRGSKYKAALSVAYGAGLRAAEVTSLKVGDIDSNRMVIRVEQGKGRKDRYVMLSSGICSKLLRAWWRAETTARLAVSRARPRAADDGRASSIAPVMPQPKGPRSDKARLTAHLTAQLRHPPARAETLMSRVIQVLAWSRPSSTPRRSIPALPPRQSARS